MNFAKIYVNPKIRYDLQHNNVKLHWINELEPMFKQNKTSNTKDDSLTFSKANPPFFIFVDVYLTVKGCVLLQVNDK